MNDIETLFRIIQKAEKNGFNYCEWQYRNTNIALFGMLEVNIKELIRTNYYKLLLLDKEFAKAYFSPLYAGLANRTIEYGWKGCLQNVVLEEDLIKYYSKFIREE